VFCADWRLRAAERLGFPLERIHETAVGCEHWRRALPALPAPADPPVVLVLGALRPERRPLAVLRAFEQLRERVPAQLVLVGRPHPAESEVLAALHASRQVAHVSRVVAPEEAELPGLVARASVLVHLDPGAGTPVTPLEALACGVPVVASRIPCFVEHLADHAELVDDGDALREPAQLAAAIERAIATRADGLALARRVAHAREHSWARCAAETAAVWRSVQAAAPAR
jgi:glycosyltransferase involved in cell wall biosynthesis